MENNQSDSLSATGYFYGLVVPRLGIEPRTRGSFSFIANAAPVILKRCVCNVFENIDTNKNITQYTTEWLKSG